MELVNQASELFPGEDHINIDNIIYDEVRLHLNVVVPEPYEERFHIAYAAR